MRERSASWSSRACWRSASSSTPAAIATILGTIVHVAVDPRRARPGCSSAQSEVRVESSDPGVKGSTTLAALEQITVKPGEAPPSRPRRLAREEIAALGGCLVDFHARLRSLLATKPSCTPWSASPPATPRRALGRPPGARSSGGRSVERPGRPRGGARRPSAAARRSRLPSRGQVLGLLRSLRSPDQVAAAGSRPGVPEK